MAMTVRSNKASTPRPRPQFIVKITRPRGPGALRAARVVTSQSGEFLAVLPAQLGPRMRLGQFTIWAWAGFREDGGLVLGKPRTF
jgi:hypothetical protein